MIIIAVNYLDVLNLDMFNPFHHVCVSIQYYSYMSFSTFISFQHVYFSLTKNVGQI